ncbi:MAG: hypothetical protein ACE14L_15605 [Terriglobales bacterium]
MLFLLVVLSGCKKKKPNLPAPQAEAPTITAAPEATVPAEPQPLPPPLATGPPPEPAASVGPPPATIKPKLKPKKPVAKKIIVPPPKEEPKPPAADNGTTSNGLQLSADLPGDQAEIQRQRAARLLAIADSNLNAAVGRSLSDDEQARVQQIRAFMTQSRAADADGDIERAYNLALKARLLSDTLVR